jgi:hypothetical protein
MTLLRKLAFDGSRRVRKRQEPPKYFLTISGETPNQSKVRLQANLKILPLAMSLLVWFSKNQCA